MKIIKSLSFQFLSLVLCFGLTLPTVLVDEAAANRVSPAQAVVKSLDQLIGTFERVESQQVAEGARIEAVVAELNKDFARQFEKLKSDLSAASNRVGALELSQRLVRQQPGVSEALDKALLEVGVFANAQSLKALNVVEKLQHLSSDRSIELAIAKTRAEIANKGFVQTLNTLKDEKNRMALGGVAAMSGIQLPGVEQAHALVVLAVLGGFLLAIYGVAVLLRLAIRSY